MPYYETGSATDFNNLMGKLRTAMAEHGWTVNFNDYEGNSGGMRCHISKGGMTVNMRTGFNNEIPVAATAERTSRQGTWNWTHQWNPGGGTQVYRPNWMAVNAGTGVNLSRSWHNQPGAPGSGELKGCASMITGTLQVSRYWIFIHEDPDFVLMIAETRPNKFEHIAFGRLVLTQDLVGGEWYSGSRRFTDHVAPPQEIAGGTFLSGSNGPSFNRDDTTCMVRIGDPRWAAADQVDGWGGSILTPGVPNSYGSTNFWAGVGIPTPDSTVSFPQQGGFYNLITSSYLDAEGRSILHPIAAYKAMETSGYTLVGYIPHMARTSMKPYVAGDQVAGLGESYMAFPSHERLSPWNPFQLGETPQDPALVSYNYYGTGVAVRKPE